MGGAPAPSCRQASCCQLLSQEAQRILVSGSHDQGDLSDTENLDGTWCQTTTWARLNSPLKALGKPWKQNPVTTYHIPDGPKD